ncbi:MAG: tRNA (N6-threonylcarbamoyladenosine(37)-N6)-methyltransferase TrmO [Methanobacterium sp.]|uniref:tRNA (N6-threonylcarbamoyladenosine(37)-N6)-methyltransferase TrmO n=1 Tax=Methanobacterium sp. TaxID=2164 RepID=UPI003D64E5C1|nr:tRNA (N6-threonylcarbamoyladenosine(37)-N6)-methyltransferase TrmO [Methanobacterium sp.]
MEMELKTVEENQVASISHIGPVEDMGEIIGELAGWIMQRGLQITQPPFVVYYTSPLDVPPQKMEYEVGIAFEGDANEDERVKIKIMPKHKVLFTLHKGSYAEIGPIYAEMMQQIMAGKYEMIGAPREAYLNNPGEVPENELLTEVIFPVMDLKDCGNPENATITENPEESQEGSYYKISPIGYVKRNDMGTYLEINDKYIPGLKELNNFSHVMVFWWADKIENTEYQNMLQTYPPYSLDRQTGVFATRAEYRPNPISVTTCKIKDIDAKTGVINVMGMDAFDGTPIIDLKPYIPSFDRVKEPKLPKWLSFLWPEWMHEQ